MNNVLSTVMQQIHLNKLKLWPASVTQLLSPGNPEVSEQDGWDHEVVVEGLARAVTIWRLYRGWACLHFSSMLWPPTSSSELIQKEEKKKHGLAVAPLDSAAVVPYTWSKQGQANPHVLKFFLTSDSYTLSEPPFWGGISYALWGRGNTGVNFYNLFSPVFRSDRLSFPLLEHSVHWEWATMCILQLKGK